MLKKFVKPLEVLIIAFLLLAIVFASINLMPAKQADAAPLGATAATFDMITKVGVTQTLYGTPQNVQAYGSGECYLDTTFDASAGPSQTLTINFEHAAVNASGKYVNYGTALAVTTSTVTSTGFSVVKGNYGRVYATVATTTWPVSYSVKCVLR